MASAALVFPVRYVCDGVAIQTTSRELSALGIAVRSLSPPNVGARVSMALYLPNTAAPEVAIGRVARSSAQAPADAGFWADFIVVDPQARMRISNLLAARDEARRPERTFARLPVHIQVRFRTAREFSEEHAINLSRGGIFIRSDEPPPVNSAVEVELQLPDGGPPVSSAGVVVHQVLPGGKKEAGVGIQFVDSSDPFRERIDRYMDSLPKN
ncbi:MAG: TIGR02266 family protein [Deltaproteobacteria bacterium]|nr:MAG: TIGR02266 family protein [Deltaproteobacteria bacterium]